MSNDPTFNLTGLTGIYAEAEQSYGKHTAFEVEIGKGHFLCMMFLSEDDGCNKDMLFVYLRHLRAMLQIKTYGNHHHGDFMIYLKECEKQMLIDELQLTRGNGNFSFIHFLNELNQKIPQSIPREVVNRTLQQNRKIIPSGVVDEKVKNILICIKQLPPDQHPLDKTLRKLYIYTDGDTETITRLIDCLKARNCTVCWTTEENRDRACTISSLINTISGRH